MSVLVIGSLNMDLITYLKRVPNGGETKEGKSFKTALGGKGANQAVQARLLGSEVYLAGALGKDLFKDEFLNYFKEIGLKTDYLKIKEGKTGNAICLVEEDGENRIIINHGANYLYALKDLKELESLIKEVKVIMLQNELKEEINEEVFKLAKKYQKTLIYNPAPMRDINLDLLKDLSFITPNEHELDSLIKGDKSLEEKALELRNLGVKNVLVTLGSKGSMLVNKEGIKYFQAYKVQALDTIGAGDSFNGALASSLDKGLNLSDAIKFATKTSALEILKEGAIPAMPTLDMVLNSKI